MSISYQVKCNNAQGTFLDQVLDSSFEKVTNNASYEVLASERIKVAVKIDKKFRLL